VPASTSKLASAATALAIIAWLVLAAGLLYARFGIADTPPSFLILPSSKGVAAILVELASLGIGCLGVALALLAFMIKGRNRTIAIAAIANVAVCVLSVALLA
jgi:hypothetical protein